MRSRACGKATRNRPFSSVNAALTQWLNRLAPVGKHQTPTIEMKKTRLAKAAASPLFRHSCRRLGFCLFRTPER